MNAVRDSINSLLERAVDWVSELDTLIIGILGLLLFFNAASVSAEGVSAEITTLTHKHATASDEYVINLLVRSLKYSIHREYQLENYPEKLTKQRLISEVHANKIQIFWSASNTQLEDQFLPIRIPLYKGLFGHRVFLIRQDQQYKFNKIKTLNQLSELYAGLGTFWEDTRILKSANLSVETSTKYNNLFLMLKGRRFDYFPRGLHEPWNELKKPGREGLVVEKNLMLVYPMPVYFFVDKENQELAETIKNGLWALIRYGEFDDLFASNPMVINAIEKAQPENRHVIRIPNQNLPATTPLDDARLWFDPNKPLSNPMDEYIK